MGSSVWTYIVPFNPDLLAVVQTLRQQIFDAADYYYLPGDDGLPATIDELLADPWVRDSGTHCILDIVEVIDADGEDRDGTLRPLRPDELVSHFGSVRPTRADVDRAFARTGTDALWKAGRWWSGYAAVIHDHGGTPTELTIWGYSGD